MSSTNTTSSWKSSSFSTPTTSEPGSITSSTAVTTAITAPGPTTVPPPTNASPPLSPHAFATTSGSKDNVDAPDVSASSTTSTPQYRSNTSNNDLASTTTSSSSFYTGILPLSTMSPSTSMSTNSSGGFSQSTGSMNTSIPMPSESNQVNRPQANIAGPVIGGIFGLLLFLVVLAFFIRRCRKQRSQVAPSAEFLGGRSPFKDENDPPLSQRLFTPSPPPIYIERRPDSYMGSVHTVGKAL